MSRVTFDVDGGFSFRTKLMTRVAARQFAKCLQANSRFECVEVADSKTAKGEKTAFITFRPSNRERQADIYEGQQASRTFKGYTEGSNYTFVADCDEMGKFWCLSTSGETYEVRPGSCSCPDFEFRCRKHALCCKHQEAYDMQRRAGLIGKRLDIAA